MGTKVRELPKVMNLPAHDPNCVTCTQVQPGKVRMDQVWAWSLAHPKESVWAKHSE